MVLKELSSNALTFFFSDCKMAHNYLFIAISRMDIHLHDIKDRQPRRDRKRVVHVKTHRSDQGWNYRQAKDSEEPIENTNVETIHKV